MTWPLGGGTGAKLAGQPAPAGERTARVLAGYRRTAGDRGRGQARPFGISDLAAVLATCHRPRRRGCGIESEQVALERGRVDAVIAGLLFMAGMRRSEVSVLRWADVVESTDGDGMLVTVRRSKTNQEGEVNDVRFVKDGVARALRMLRAAMSPEPSDRVVPLSAQMIGLRFTAAALVAGVESRVTAHSGRVGLASELTSRGASTTDVMLAGNWKTSRMVAHLLRRGDCATWCRRTLSVMLEHLPNALTALRIAAVPVLAWLAIVRDGDVFVAVLIACLIGDVVDGRLARALNATSSLGAQLDSIADTLLFLAAAGGIAVFHAEVISKHAVVFTLVPSAWIGENLVALWRYGRLSSFHTYLSRAAAVAMGLFVGALFVVGEQPALLFAAAGLVLVGHPRGVHPDVAAA